MAEHRATIDWANPNEEFTRGRYSREHTWAFDGGVVVQASPSPAVVPAPWSNEAAVDPEEAYVASVSSCHMLTFLALAAKKRFVVDSYVDDAVGFMEKNEDGRVAVTRVVLRPDIAFSGDRVPGPEDLDRLHHQAHQHCFIANSVRTEITVEAPAS